MTLQQLHYAIVISETGSMNKAAERLYISQPSLTGAVQELEKELGITVFHRSARGVTLTNDGQEFIAYAKQVYDQYEQLTEKYGPEGNIKKKFGVTTQHYSFAVKAFVEMVKGFDTSKYEFAIREARTREVIDDVASLRSEIGILYLSNFNRKVITKILNANEIAFHELIDCKAYVYLWKGHPLADKKSICMEELGGYPFLSLILNTAIALTTILGYSAMSGILGGGGLGKIAINYGYYRYQYLVMLFAVVCLIILVQIFQSARIQIQSAA